MSEESPPTYTTPIFNQAYFGTTDGGLDTAYLNSHYLRYPTAQTGLETIANLATTNDATINGLTVGKGKNSIATNTAVGISALAANTTGTENTAIGDGALESATTAAQNTAVGHEALYNTTTGGTQTALGFHAARNATGTNNTAIGYRAFRGTFGSNSGIDNVAIGSDSVFKGGTRAIGIGVEALYNGGGVDCVAVGYKALHENPGANNTAVGNYALNAVNGLGENNTAIGFEAGTTVTTGDNNTYVGYETGMGVAQSGVANTAVGYVALTGITSGNGNIAVGAGALQSTTTGSYNIGIGYQAGFAGTALTTGSNNTFVGNQAQANANNYSNSTALGSGATITSSNSIMLGTSSEKVYMTGNGTYPLPYIVASGSAVLTATAGTGRVSLGTFTLPAIYSFLFPVICNGDSSAGGTNLTITAAVSASSPYTVFVVFNNATAGSIRVNYVIYAIM